MNKNKEGRRHSGDIEKMFTMYVEGAASDTRARHGSERADLKNKHDREMDAARLLDTQKKNMKEEIK